MMMRKLSAHQASCAHAPLSSQDGDRGTQLGASATPGASACHSLSFLHPPMPTPSQCHHPWRSLGWDPSRRKGSVTPLAWLELLLAVPLCPELFSLVAPGC